MVLQICTEIYWTRKVIQYSGSKILISSRVTKFRIFRTLKLSPCFSRHKSFSFLVTLKGEVLGHRGVGLPLQGAVGWNLNQVHTEYGQYIKSLVPKHLDFTHISVLSKISAVSCLWTFCIVTCNIIGPPQPESEKVKKVPRY